MTHNIHNTPKKLSEEALRVLKASYTYDRDNGRIINNRSGGSALAPQSNGYLQLKVQLNGKLLACVKTHHVVWFFEYGEWPTSCMDHIDGDKTNNHYTNLRLVTNRENSQAYRMSKKKDQSSPYLGVYKPRHRGFRAAISVNGKNVRLGCFTCELEAARAYDKALVEMGLKPVNIYIMEKNVVNLYAVEDAQ